MYNLLKEVIGLQEPQEPQETEFDLEFNEQYSNNDLEDIEDENEDDFDEYDITDVFYLDKNGTYHHICEESLDTLKEYTISDFPELEQLINIDLEDVVYNSSDYIEYSILNIDVDDVGDIILSIN